jgi:zinc protease
LGVRNAACLLLAAGSLLLQVSTASAQGTFPTKPPASLPPRPFSLPASETRTLPNGLKVIVTESHRVPLVTMRLAVRAGSILDAPDQPGLASAVADQMTAGTAKYSSLQLREAGENLGGTVNVGAGDDFAMVSGSALAENAAPLIDLMAEVLLHPTFPENELGIYKGLTLQRLVVQRQNPSFLANEQISKALYGDHPYGVVSTTRAAVEALTRDRLLDFYRAHYVPAGAVLVVVGDIKPKAVFDKVSQALGGWTGSAASATNLPDFPTRDARQLYLVNRPGSVQSNIVVGNLALKRGDPDYYALTVANTILGGGSDSRLFDNVREKHGYAYSVGSALDPRALSGDFTASAQTRTDVTAPALTEMLKEAETIRSAPVSSDALQNAKNYITGTFVLRLTSQSGLADQLLNVEVYGLPSDYLTTYRDRINALSAGDVQQAAQKYIQPDKAAIVVVGDADKLRDGLKAIAPVSEVK